jgi:DNA-binding Lrp family transcriptional regulator
MAKKTYENAVAVLLITTEPGREHDVVAQLRGISEVKETLLLFGEYDVYAKLECTDFGLLSNVVVSQIRNIEGVEATKTLTAAPML